MPFCVVPTAACAIMALKDGAAGWDHRPTGSTYRSAQELLEGEKEPMPWDVLIPKIPNLQMVGLVGTYACVHMCVVRELSDRGAASMKCCGA